MAYTKPLVGPLGMDSETSGCCFFVTDSGQGVFIYTGDGSGNGGTPGGSGGIGGIGGAGAISDLVVGGPIGVPAPNGQVASVGNGGLAVTPLCGTGLPATQPIVFGVPVGVSGVNATVGANGIRADADPSALSVTVLGQTIPVPL